jgi:hypothetical protein
MSNSQQAKQHMTKVMMSDAAREIKDVQVKDLSAWDRASARKAQELQNSVELEEFRNQIKRIFELAGLNYELEKQNFWSRYNHIKQQNDLND